MDGLKPAERDILRAVENSGGRGQLFKSPPISALCEKYGARGVQEALRTLMQAKRIQVTLTADQGHLLTLPRAQLTDGTQMILSIITDAGTHGVDAISIGQRTKLPRTEVLKSLQSLLHNQTIKETRNFVNRAQKIYMLASLEPSERVTGGSFFTDRVLDNDFIQRAREVIHARLKQQEVLKVSEMKAALDADATTAQRHLSMKEVAILARTLELDDLVRRVHPPTTNPPPTVLFHDYSEVTFCVGSRSSGAASSYEYPPIEMTLAASVPCTGCPHLNDCDVQGKGLINPIGCRYLTAWIAKAAPLPQQQQLPSQQSSLNSSSKASMANSSVVGARVPSTTAGNVG